MFQLSEIDQKTLLEIARSSVQAHIAGQTLESRVFRSGILAQTHGIFVSIHRDGELRGCIGNVHPAAPLYSSAGECAIAAAFGDPRFVPLMIDELALVDFEISVLSPMEIVTNVREIEVGKHGVMLSKRKARGILLPQVAATYGWDIDRFLEEACRKAGLGPDEWKQGATIHRFSAFVFGESRLRMTATP
jgi:AmmeMemoRadiSam system protein A